MKSPPGSFALGSVSLRQLLTFVSHWQEAGGYLHPLGIWPHQHDRSPDAGPLWELGPVASAQYPLLTDDQILSLLCEGSPDLRPSAEVGRDILSGLGLDLHRPDARARAIHCAAIFAEWRDGTYDWQSRNGAPLGDSRAGAWCRLAHTRASMGRLIAGLDGSLLQAGSDGAGATEAVVYIAEAIPVGGFFGLDPPQASLGRADAAAAAASAASAGGAAAAAMLGEPAPADYGAEPDPAPAAAGGAVAAAPPGEPQDPPRRNRGRPRRAQ